MTLPVFLHPDLASVAAGAAVELDGDEAHHAVVKRIRPGEQVALTDGAGTTAVLTVSAATKTSLSGVVDSVRSVEREMPRVVVVQAIPKGDRGELAGLWRLTPQRRVEVELFAQRSRAERADLDDEVARVEQLLRR